VFDLRIILTKIYKQQAKSIRDFNFSDRIPVHQPIIELKGFCKAVKKRVTLTFPKRTIQMPVTYRLAKDFNVAANIIRAQVAPNQIGKLVVELSGDIDALDGAIEWMRSQDINVSFASREIVIDEDICVHCGLCTGVCPTEALTLDPQTFKLTFTRSRCIVCEQCIPTCPVQAISTNF
jgi:L-aspartate semialdehyde sulfurtransferase ferredoxin